MKRILLLMLALTLVFSMLAACTEEQVAESNESTQTETPVKESEETTETEEVQETEAPVSKEPITFWIYEGATVEGETIIELLMDQFTAETGYKVDLVVIPRVDFKTKLAASTAIGEGPDIAYMDQPDVAMYATDDMLYDLSDFAANDSDFNADDYYTGAYQTNLVGGKLYGLPLNHTTVAIFYNKDLVQNVPSTWDEWVAESKRIYEDSNGEVAAFEQLWSGSGGAWLFPAFVYNAGGSMVNEEQTACVFADEGGIEAINLIQDLYEYSPLEIRSASNAFLNGLAAFKMSGPWEIQAFDESEINYGVMLMPTKEGDVHYSNIGGEDIVAFKDARNIEGAWELMNFLTRKDINSKFVLVTGNYPANKNSDISEYLAHHAYSVFFKQLENAMPRPRVTNWIKINDDYIGTALDQILVAGEDPATTLKQAQEDANTIFGEKTD